MSTCLLLTVVLPRYRCAWVTGRSAGNREPGFSIQRRQERFTIIIVIGSFTMRSCIPPYKDQVSSLKRTIIFTSSFFWSSLSSIYWIGPYKIPPLIHRLLCFWTHVITRLDLRWTLYISLFIYFHWYLVPELQSTNKQILQSDLSFRIEGVQLLGQ